jgi:predicted N-formylglutamate amidohydrolase
MQPSTDSVGRYRLLEPGEPPACLEGGQRSQSSFVIVVDHASPRIPKRLSDLGLPSAELRRHIAWDIGALAVAREVTCLLDAVLLAQNYSRLVIDCNRDPNAGSSIPRSSEATEIPGNLDLSQEGRSIRRAEIFDPYHARLRGLLDERASAGRPTILVAQHSMTEVYLGVPRAMHAAVLYNRDRRLASLVLDCLRREPHLVVAENEPYVVNEVDDFTIPRHAEARGLPCVAIEVRQDLISDLAGQKQWAQRIARALQDAERRLAKS